MLMRRLGLHLRIKTALNNHPHYLTNVKDRGLVEGNSSRKTANVKRKRVAEFRGSRFWTAALNFRRLKDDEDLQKVASPSRLPFHVLRFVI